MRYKTIQWMVIFVVACQLTVSLPTPAQEAATQEAATQEAEPVIVEQVADEPIEQEKRFVDFGNLLKNSALVGTFTVDGDNQSKARPERYEISKVVKQPVGDYWNFFARIKYAQHDVTLPIPVEVKWAGSTPVITVDNLTIPGMGTFDARVVISDNKYAGTWRHGNVGGLMYGHIKKQDAAENVEKTQ